MVGIIERILNYLGIHKVDDASPQNVMKLFGGDIHLHFHINLYKVSGDKNAE